MIFREFLSGSYLAKAQAFSIHELQGIIIVSKNEDLIFAALQVMVPSLKDLNDSQELLVMSFVPRLCQNHLH